MTPSRVGRPFTARQARPTGIRPQPVQAIQPPGPYRQIGFDPFLQLRVELGLAESVRGPGAVGQVWKMAAPVRTSLVPSGVLGVLQAAVFGEIGRGVGGRCPLGASASDGWRLRPSQESVRGSANRLADSAPAADGLADVLRRCPPVRAPVVRPELSRLSPSSPAWRYRDSMACGRAALGGSAKSGLMRMGSGRFCSYRTKRHKAA